MAIAHIPFADSKTLATRTFEATSYHSPRRNGDIVGSIFFLPSQVRVKCAPKNELLSGEITRINSSFGFPCQKR